MLVNKSVTLLFTSWDRYISTISFNKTVFPHRSFKFVIQFMISWNNEKNVKTQLKALNNVYSTLYDDSTKYSYIDYINRDVLNWMNVYYHMYQQRLINIKHIYDKNNRFYFERTIQ